MKPKRPILIAESVAVVCPECSECQPTDDGSHLWMPDELKHAGIRYCHNCGAKLLIELKSKVNLE